MRKLVLYLAMVLVLGSCIQSEPLNAEADILECKILNEKGEVEKNIKGNIIINNNQILAQANPRIDLTRLALQVKLTEGATISPDPAQVRDYSKVRNFIVLSQDGNWNKPYTVSIDTFDLPAKYSFEDVELNENKKFQVFYEKVEGREATFNQYVWASGNSGYALTGRGKTYSDYPTVSLERGYEGKGIKLETQSTGDFGKGVKMPIAAGNLFLGSFDVTSALAKPLKATLFGLPFKEKPIRFKGYYKYTPGSANFTIAELDKDKNPKVIPGQEDSGDIYAVLYESAGLDGNALDGNNVLTSGNIVAMARVEDMKATNDYIYFDIKFRYKGEEYDPITWPSFIERDKSDDGNGSYLVFDEEKLKNYEYNLAVVFTSSKYGAYFAGKVGSTLCVDEVEVVCK